MANIMDFNPSKPLPEELRYESADKHLYRIGLCLTKDEELLRRRKWFNQPFVVFTAFIMFLTERLITTFIENNHNLYVIFGDWPRLLGFGGLYVGAVYILITLLAIGWQLIYLYNYSTGVEPTFLKVFHMMSGSLTPSAVGLKNKQNIIKLTRQMEKYCKIMQFNAEYVGSIACAFVSPLGYLLSTSLISAVLFGIPNTLLLIQYTFYFWEVISYQMIYIHFVCKYLKLKIDELNESLSELSDKQRVNTFRAIETILKSHDSLYTEINEYNKTFFSKIYLIFWSTFGSATVFFLYISLFTNMLFYVRVLVVYFLILFMAIFLFVIFTASSVNTKSFDSYSRLNRLYLSVSKNQNRNHFAVQTKIKVSEDIFKSDI